MRGVELRATGVRVTELVLGGAPLGGLYDAVGEEAAQDTVDAAWAAGVRAFDTAPHYGTGLSERRLGAALRGRPRGEYVLCTKVGRLLVAASGDAGGGDEFAEGSGLERRWDFSRDGVRRSLAESLERLGLDRVDVVHVHDPEHHMEQALAEALPALVELREEGVIGAVGAGVNFAPEAARIVREADVDCVLIAGRCTLLDRAAETDLLPLCEERGVSVLAAGVFNSGVLADPRPGATYDYRPAPPEVLDRARRIAAVCERHGVPLVTAAIAFPLRHPAVAAVVVGARSPAEVAASEQALATTVPDVLWEDLQREGLLDAA